MSSAQTIVRMVKGGSDPASHRFVIVSEASMSDRSFIFLPTHTEMSMGDVCRALVAYGISERDAFSLLKDAVASFEHP